MICLECGEEFEGETCPICGWSAFESCTEDFGVGLW